MRQTYHISQLARNAFGILCMGWTDMYNMHQLEMSSHNYRRAKK